MSAIEDFRAETRAWLEANCPESQRGAAASGDLVFGGSKVEFANEGQQLWFERMRDRNWFCPDWPAAYGGGGLSPEEDAVLQQELKRLKCRPPQINLGIWMLGPVLLEFGTEEQKKRLLTPMTRGEVRWCQGSVNPMRALIWPTSAPLRSMQATIMWSMAAKSGPPMATSPIGCTRWCEPIAAVLKAGRYQPAGAGYARRGR